MFGDILIQRGTVCLSHVVLWTIFRSTQAGLCTVLADGACALRCYVVFARQSNSFEPRWQPHEAWRPDLQPWNTNCVCGCATGTDASGPGGPAPFTSIRECLEEDVLLAVVARCNDALLGAEGGGRNTLISRIVAVIKVRPSLARLAVCAFWGGANETRVWGGKK